MPDLALENRPSSFEALESQPDDRDRLIQAATRIATERGFEGLDAEQLARATGLTLDDFHRHFDNVDQCILAAFDRFFQRLVEHVSEASEGVPGWPEKVGATIVAGLEFIAELEPVTRLFTVDALCAGPGLIERRISSIERGAVQLKAGRELYPGSAELPDSMERTLVAGVVMLATTYVLGEEAWRLTEVQSELVAMVLTPYLGIEGARRVAS
jgi:AcrR family transcriptional regulator